MFDKNKFLSVMKQDVKDAISKRDANDPNDARCAIIHHICKDEAEYAQSIIDAIERGDYDEMTSIRQTSFKEYDRIFPTDQSRSAGFRRWCRLLWGAP